MTDISLCIIDDIKSVVDGVATRIDWKAHGITVCGTALNGEKGLELIERCRPDIILTDIRMPKLDGLELTRRVKEICPHSKVLLFTGYTDFEYAQQAVRLGAFDFIAKPFSHTQIEQAILKAKQAVVQQQAKWLEREQLQRKLDESMPTLLQQYLNLFIRHRMAEDRARDRWKFLQIDLAPEKLAIMVLHIDRFSERRGMLVVQEMELLLFSLQNIVEETVRAYTKGLVFRESESRFAVVYNETEERIGTEMAESCRLNIEQYTRNTVSVGVGGVVERISDLPDSFEQAMSALSYHFYTEGNSVVVYADIERTDPMLPRYSPDLEQEMLHSLRSGNRSMALKLLDDLLGELTRAERQPDPRLLTGVLHELAYRMLRVFREKVDEDELAPLLTRVREHWLTASISLAEIREELASICEIGCDCIERKYNLDSALIVEKAIQYIRNHLHADLSVSSCARHVHLSRSYFANLFKKMTGTTFHHFVTQERMERAKQMLLADMQVQEIAEALGYGERRYFTEVFKKQVGMTPSEFRQTYVSH
ncbi:response regulator [Paenibacillus sp. FSL K6-2862]|uniref:response regulator n=1 Tax=Paenibacillus sp. FSL K6-2862 TaxID=2921484 RepID=UPI0030F968F6